jgi:hypothetical protein
MSFMADEDWITTGDAARLTGRDTSAFRWAITHRQVRAIKHDGLWRMRRQDALAWHRQAKLHPLPGRRRVYEDVAALLTEYGSLDPDELSLLLGVHVGNARKHLAILCKQGRARRDADGQWYPDGDGHAVAC